jgi:hypothetical protein
VQIQEVYQLNKKQIKGVVITLELFLIAALFLPAGTVTGANNPNEGSLSVFGMIDRYAGMGFSDDARFYTIMAFALPIAIILCLLFLKERANFISGIVISALYATASACFFSSAKGKMVDYATLTSIPYFMVILSLVCMLLLILGLFQTAPGNSDEK